MQMGLLQKVASSARIMKKKGLYAQCRRRFKTLKPSGIKAVAGNLLNRQFCPIRPDLVWAGDITYIDTTEGWRYLAVWMDLHSRRIIGWALRETMESSLVTEAPELAFGCRAANPQVRSFKNASQKRRSRAASLAKAIAGIMLLLRASSAYGTLG